MTGKQEGPYKGEETKAEEDKVWHIYMHRGGFVDLFVFLTQSFPAGVWAQDIHHTGAALLWFTVVRLPLATLAKSQR